MHLRRGRLDLGRLGAVEQLLQPGAGTGNLGGGGGHLVGGGALHQLIVLGLGPLGGKRRLLELEALRHHADVGVTLDAVVGGLGDRDGGLRRAELRLGHALLLAGRAVGGAVVGGRSGCDPGIGRRNILCLRRVLQQFKLRLGRFEAGERLGALGFQGGAVEAGEHVAFLHLVAHVHQHLEHLARDLGGHGHLLVGGNLGGVAAAGAGRGSGCAAGWSACAAGPPPGRLARLQLAAASAVLSVPCRRRGTLHSVAVLPPASLEGA